MQYNEWESFYEIIPSRNNNIDISPCIKHYHTSQVITDINVYRIEESEMQTNLDYLLTATLIVNHYY